MTRENKERAIARELKKSILQKLRMDGRDYSRPGWYFITLGADYHQTLFGRAGEFLDGIYRMNRILIWLIHCGGDTGIGMVISR